MKNFYREAVEKRVPLFCYRKRDGFAHSIRPLRPLRPSLAAELGAIVHKLSRPLRNGSRGESGSLEVQSRECLSPEFPTVPFPPRHPAA